MLSVPLRERGRWLIEATAALQHGNKQSLLWHDGTSLPNEGHILFSESEGEELQECRKRDGVVQKKPKGIRLEFCLCVSHGGFVTICLTSAALVLDIAATLTCSNPRCHFIVHEESPAANYAVWFSLDCCSVGSDVISQFVLWEQLPIVYLITMRPVFDWQHTKVRGQYVSRSPCLDKKEMMNEVSSLADKLKWIDVTMRQWMVLRDEDVINIMLHPSVGPHL